MELTHHPLVGILLLLKKLHPHPWFFKRDPDLLGWRPENVPALLNKLHDERLVEKVNGTAETGPGVALTAEGRRAVDDPGSLDRVARGVPVNGPDPNAGESAPAGPPPPVPWAARAVVAANVAVFLWGLWLASRAASIEAFLWGPRRTGILERYLRILHDQGAATAEDLLDGAWWRLVTAGLVHAGLLHLALNMLWFWGVAATIERAYGWWRFVLIYLFGCLGGTTLAMAYTPTLPTAGVAASSALCGMLGALAVYAVLHRSQLSAESSSSIWWSLLTSALILGIFSLMPGMSGWGLLGGGIGGAAAAVPMYFGRYGNIGLKVITPMLLVPVAWGIIAFLQSSREQSRPWVSVEMPHLIRAHQRAVRDEINGAFAYYDREVERGLFEMHPQRRDPEKVKEVMTKLEEHVDKLRERADRLERDWTYRTSTARDAVGRGAEAMRESADYYTEAARLLKEDQRIGKAEVVDLNARWAKVQKAGAAWDRKLVDWKEEIKDDPPRRRKPG